MFRTCLTKKSHAINCGSACLSLTALTIILTLFGCAASRTTGDLRRGARVTDRKGDPGNTPLVGGVRMDSGQPYQPPAHLWHNRRRTTHSDAFSGGARPGRANYFRELQSQAVIACS